MQQKFRRQNDIKVKLINHIFHFIYHEKKISAPIDLKNIKKVLIIDYSLIGDAIMSIPLLKILHQNCPNAKIDVVCSETERILLKDQNLIDKYWIVNFDDLLSINHPFKMVKYIRKICRMINAEDAYDIAIEPRGDVRLLWFMHYLVSKRKISYDYSGGEYFLTDVMSTDGKVSHLLDEKLNILSFIGCKFNDADRIPRLAKTEESVEYVDNFVRENKLEHRYVIGIHPGSSLNIKKWEHYDLLVQDLNKKIPNCTFILFAGPGEKEADEIASAARQTGTSVIISRTKLKEYTYLISACDCLVCNDSGAGHISTALGVNTVVVLGPYTPDYCAPIGANIIPISKDIDCKPCLLRECRDGSKRCLNMITVEEVSDAVMHWYHSTDGVDGQ